MSSRTAATQASGPTGPGAMTRGSLMAVMVAAIGSLLLAVIDGNIVTTAAVPIARDLQPRGGASQVPWLVTAYLLAGTVVQPLYGKLCDRVGTRPVYLGSVGVFLVGSVLCGLATSMPELIAFRAFQGLGGGGLFTVTMVVIGHLRAEDSEAVDGGNGNGLAGAMVGFGLVCAPLLGGALIAYADWRWIFFANLPLGLAAWLVMARCLRLRHRPVREPIDAVSGVLLGAAGAVLLLVCAWGGNRYAWTSTQVIVLALLGLSLAGAFGWRQRRSVAPFFPPRLLRHPGLRVVSFLQFATGVGMAAGTVYIVLALQLVHGKSPVGTGVALIPEAVGLAVGAFCGGLLLKRHRSLRWTVVAGTALTAAAMGGFATLSAGSPWWTLSLLLLVFGGGVGLTMGNEVIIVQSHVDRGDLGMATTGVRFVESVGGSLGAAALGAVFAAVVGVHGHDVAVVMHAVHLDFTIGAVLLAVATVVAFWLPAGLAPRPE